jgi:hypothetical protein
MVDPISPAVPQAVRQCLLSYLERSSGTTAADALNPTSSGANDRLRQAAMLRAARHTDGEAPPRRCKETVEFWQPTREICSWIVQVPPNSARYRPIWYVLG